MDTIDNSILNRLRDNARTPISTLSAETGISRSAVRSRITKLEESGVIHGYRADIGRVRSFGSGVSVLMIRTEPQAYDRIAERLTLESCVISLFRLSGDNTLCAVCSSTKEDCAAENLAWRYRTYQDGIERISISAVSEVFKGGLLPVSLTGGADNV